LEWVQNQKMLIAGDHGRRFTLHCHIQKLVVLRIATGLNLAYGWDDTRHAAESLNELHPIHARHIGVKLG
jgi:hypothetical protein